MGIIIIMHTQSNLVNHRVGEVWEGTGRGKPLSSGTITITITHNDVGDNYIMSMSMSKTMDMIMTQGS